MNVGNITITYDQNADSDDMILADEHFHFNLLWPGASGMNVADFDAMLVIRECGATSKVMANAADESRCLRWLEAKEATTAVEIGRDRGSEWG